MRTAPIGENPIDILDHAIPRIDVLDIGAMWEDGGDRYEPLVAHGLANVTGFEPNPAEFAKLANRQGPYRYLPMFLGDGQRATFHLTRYPGCSSLLEPNPAVIDLFETMGCGEDGNFRVIGKEPVQTTRLDDLGNDVRADCIKVDVQGSELSILRHGQRVLAEAVIVETEAEFVPLYRDQPLFGDLQCFLRDRGFLLHKFVDLGGRPFRPVRPPNPFAPLSQVLWADAVFVRDFSRLDAYSDSDLLKATAILHLVYRSYDLAGLLLREYDERRGTALWPRYSEWLKLRDLPSTAVTVLTHHTSTSTPFTKG